MKKMKTAICAKRKKTLLNTHTCTKKTMMAYLLWYEMK
jgi:hypothetical protein